MRFLYSLVGFKEEIVFLVLHNQMVVERDNSICVSTCICDFPLFASMEIYDYWKYCFQGAKTQMEVEVRFARISGDGSATAVLAVEGRIASLEFHFRLVGSICVVNKKRGSFLLVNQSTQEVSLRDRSDHLPT